VGALLLLASPEPLTAQLRREAPVQPVSTVLSGDLLVGMGVSYATGGTYPLSGFTGDLLSIPEVTVAYGLGDRALISVSGAVFQRLSIRERSEPSVTLDPDTADGSTSDFGDFRIATAFAPLGSADGFSAGGLVEVTLPNSDEKQGIGTNTTDVVIGLLGSWGSPSWRATGTIGVGILQVPLHQFVQDDPFAYALDVLFHASSRIRLSVGLRGRVNTRSSIPLGTESRGAGTVGAEWLAGAWRLDTTLSRGYAGNTPDWRVAAGAAWTRSSGGRR